ncbi:MAG: GNAT family N-acetyltransferase [Armatimonadota bacterium]
MFSYPLTPDTELKLLEPRYAGELFTLIDQNRHYLRRWLPWIDECQSREDRHGYLTWALSGLADTGSFAAGIWHRGVLAGMIVLNPIHRIRHSTSLVYFLGNAYQGRGLATLGCHAVANHAFHYLGVHRLEIHVASMNIRGHGVPERLGFHHEGTHHGALWLCDRYVDEDVYALLAEEWDGRPEPLFRHRISPEVELQLLEPRHAEAVFALIDRNRAYLRRWISVGRVMSAEEERKRIQHGIRAFVETGGFDAGIWWQGQLAGIIGFLPIDWGNRIAEIGYWIAEEYQGHGVVTLSCRSLIDYAFDTLGLNRVELHIDPDNTRSCQVAERLGFTAEGTLRAATRMYDDYADRTVYALLRDEWERRQA